jgi:hypothetical protein
MSLLLLQQLSIVVVASKELSDIVVASAELSNFVVASSENLMLLLRAEKSNDVVASG